MTDELGCYDEVSGMLLNQQEQTNQNIKKFIEELEYKISQSCYIENQGVNDLFDDIKELTSKYFPQITNHNSLTNPSLDEVSNYQKQQAKYLISKEIKNGKMKRGICESCGCNKNIIGHHKDYSKPLDVNWYCRKCHLKLHNIRSFLKSDANKRISITLSGRKLSEEHKKNISKKESVRYKIFKQEIKFQKV